MNKQKGLAPILIVLLIAVVVGGILIYQITKSTPAPTSVSESTTSAETSNWKTYVSTTAGFSVRYPSEWNEIHIGDTGSYAGQVAFGPGVKSITEDRNIKFSVQVQKNHGQNGPAPIQNAADYVKLDLNGNKSSPNFDRGNIDQINIEGITAYRLKYSFKNMPSENIVIALNYKDYIYAIYGTNTNIFNQILSTIKFTQ